jgi:PAS domain S-box-containing protein
MNGRPLALPPPPLGVVRPAWYWLTRLAYWPAWLALLLGIALGLGLMQLQREHDLAAQRQQVDERLALLRARLEATAHTTFSPTAGLATLIQLDGDISAQRFEQLIARALTLVPQLRSVVAAPDDVARHVYPRAGNEAVINLDYRSIPVQWAQVQEAKRRRQPLLLAPVKLVQGGLGVIQRSPVFLREEASAGGGRYWGMVSVVADLERFMRAAGLNDDAELELAAFSAAADGSPDQPIWGRWQGPLAEGVRQTAQLPGADWVLLARPRAGWGVNPWSAAVLAAWGGGLLLSLMLALLLRQWRQLCEHNEALSREIEHGRQVQGALERSQAELQAVLDAAIEVGIVTTDAEDRITVFNRGAERMLGYSEAEVLGRSPRLWHVEAEVQARGAALSQQLGRPVAVAEVFRALPLLQGSDTRDWTFVRRDGSRLEASLTVSGVFLRSGENIGFLGVARDISAQRAAERELRALNSELEARVHARTAELSAALEALQQAQEELLRAEKMAALGSLVAGVAHELNTPLGNCLTTASTLHERTGEIGAALAGGPIRRSALDAYLRDAASASELLLRGLSTATELVQHFKQLSVDQTSEQRRRFALREVVGDVAGLAAARWRGTPYRLTVGELALPRELDSYPGPLGQVLGNLLQNALMHAFEGREQGELTISARPLSEREFELEVADDGRGMDEAVRHRAFDPFFTTKLGQGGTGLGLNIVYNIVTGVLGGRVELHSSPGAGSRFVFRLPYEAPRLA